MKQEGAMSIFMVLASVAMTAAVAADTPPVAKAEKPACENHRLLNVQTGKAVGVRPLAQEPDARHLQAVVRTLDGCGRPIVLEENVGIRGRSGPIRPVRREK